MANATTATEKIIKLLLISKKRWKQAELAKAASCSKAYVSKLSRKLLEEGIISRPRAQSLLLISFSKALSYLASTRKLPKPIYIKTRYTKEEFEKKLKGESGYCLTLFSAAWQRTKFMRTNTLEVYVAKEKLKQFIRKFGKQTRKATNVILFRAEKDILEGAEKIGSLWLVSPIQNYVDLMALGGTATRVAAVLAKKYDLVE